MTTTNTDALDPHDAFARNLVAKAVMDAHDGWVPLSLRYRIADKALEALAPIVAVEVRKAKAEAWDEGASEGAGAAGLIFSMNLSTPPILRNPYRYESGDSDEHR